MSDLRVILTGLRANNDLHIGNYLGGLLPMIDMANNRSDEFQINLFIPDLHSFTTPIDHDKLQEGIKQNLRVFVAAGLPLDIDNVNIYRQSYIPAHSELTWILDCFVGMGELSRMTQYKDKSSKLNEDRISVGLFNYPVLMAADILLYGATYVPVGEDQTQHLEFTRDIAQRFNAKFGEIFVVPKPVQEQHEFFGKDQGLRIKDLADPTKKMSKSDDSGKGVIFLSESAESARAKIMAATTDSIGSINYDKANQPGISNMLDILAFLSGQDLEAVTTKYKGSTAYGQLKEDLSAVVEQYLAEFQNSLDKVDDEQIEQKLINCEQVLTTQANNTLLKVQQAVGLR